MSDDASAAAARRAGRRAPRLALLLAAAMFVLVVDTSLMNVSISAVVKDLDTTVSGVQSAIALEALVSAAFILISSKVGDLIGRKRAYVLGLLAYAIGALAMTLAQNLTAIIIFWAILGGSGCIAAAARHAVAHPRELRRSGRARRPTPWSGQRRRSPPRSGRCSEVSSRRTCRGGSASSSRSWSSRWCSPTSGWSATCPTRASAGRRGWRCPLGCGMGGVVLGILVWQEGGEAVGALIAVGVLGLVALSYWLCAPQASGQAHAARSGPVPLPALQGRHPPADDAADHPRRGDDRAPDLLADDARVQRDGSGAVAGSVVAEHVRGGPGGRAKVRQASSEQRRSCGVHPDGRRNGPDHPARALEPTSAGGSSVPCCSRVPGLGLLVSQLNNYTLAPIEEERVSEAAGVNSAAGSFGLSFGLAVAGGLMLAALSLASPR